MPGFYAKWNSKTRSYTKWDGLETEDVYDGSTQPAAEGNNTAIDHVEGEENESGFYAQWDKKKKKYNFWNSARQEDDSNGLETVDVDEIARRFRDILGLQPHLDVQSTIQHAILRLGLEERCSRLTTHDKACAIAESLELQVNIQ